jgi:hypothetical protein
MEKFPFYNAAAAAHTTTTTPTPPHHTIPTTIITPTTATDAATATTAATATITTPNLRNKVFKIFYALNLIILVFYWTLNCRYHLLHCVTFDTKIFFAK